MSLSKSQRRAVAAIADTLFPSLPCPPEYAADEEARKFWGCGAGKLELLL